MSEPTSPLAGLLANAKANGPQRKTRTIPTPNNASQQKRPTPMADPPETPEKAPEVAAEAVNPTAEGKDTEVQPEQHEAPPVAPVPETAPDAPAAEPVVPEPVAQEIPQAVAPIDPPGTQEVTVYEAPTIPQLPSAQTLHRPKSKMDPVMESGITYTTERLLQSLRSTYDKLMEKQESLEDTVTMARKLGYPEAELQRLASVYRWHIPIEGQQ